MSSVEPYEIEYLQEQIYNLSDDIRDLQSKVDELQMENTLLKQDLTIIKNEGCWRFVEDSNHIHKSNITNNENT
jgi:regulator of replication initiation timing